VAEMQVAGRARREARDDGHADSAQSSPGV
jgi:hypothetical protein